MDRKRNAVKYNSVGLFLTDSTDGGQTVDSLDFVNRVQSTNISVQVQRQEIKGIGSQDFIDRKIVSEPNISVNIDYLLTDGHEERKFGFNIDSPESQEYSGSIYKNLKEDKSLILAIGEEQFDLTGSSNRVNGYSGIDIIGIGNCYINNYSINAGVGTFAKASVSMTASNIRHSCESDHQWIDKIEEIRFLMTQINEFIELEKGGLIPLQNAGTTGYAQGNPIYSIDLQNGGIDFTGGLTYVNEEYKAFGVGMKFNPSIYKSPVSAIPPGGINVIVEELNVAGPILSGDNNGGCIKGAANIQSFDINLPLERENLYGFGSMHAFGRKLKMPQLGTVSFSLLSSAFKTGDLRDMFCDDKEYNIDILLNNRCDFDCRSSKDHDTFIKYTINNAKFDGYTFNESIGSFATIDCNFSFGVSENNGLFVSGSFEST